MANATEDESTLAQVARAREEARHTAKTGEGLPQGSAPIETREEDEETTEETTELEASAGEESTTEEAATEGEESTDETEEEVPVRIGDKEFKSEKEAFRYAEQLELEKAQLEAYNQGIRDTLGSKGVVPNAEAPQEEEDFDTKFYADPKAALKEVKEQATRQALAVINQEKQRESLWAKFEEKYPDVRRKDAERILQEPDNWPVLSQMKDLDKAMGILATKTRAEYEEIRNLGKPRTVLTKKNGATPASGGTKPGVTPKPNEEKPLDFVTQMKRMRK